MSLQYFFYEIKILKTKILYNHVALHNGPKYYLIILKNLQFILFNKLP